MPALFPLLAVLFLASCWDSYCLLEGPQSGTSPPFNIIIFKFSWWHLLTVFVSNLLSSLTPWHFSFLRVKSPTVSSELVNELMETIGKAPCTAVVNQKLNYLCQNSREGHTVPQPRSFLARAKSSRFRGFRLVNSGATASFSGGSTAGFTSGLELVENAATPHPMNGNNQTNL